ISASEEIDQTVGADFRQIAGLVYSIVRIGRAGGRARARYKNLVRFLFVAPVARAQPHTADEQVANLARRRGMKSAILVGSRFNSAGTRWSCAPTPSVP